MADGTLELIDGHMRQEELSGNDVPCVVLDVSAEEADKLMLTFDPIGAMAAAGEAELSALVESTKFDEAELNVLIEKLSAEADKAAADGDAATGDADQGREIPEMELQPYEHYDYVLLLCRNTPDWEYLCEKLGLSKVNSSVVPVKKKVGLGRAVDASRLISLLRGK